MKRVLVVLLLLSCYFLKAVNGEVVTEENRKVIRVWGTHFERGNAQGYLLSENIMNTFNSYILSFSFSGNSFYYNQAYQLVTNNYTFEAEYLDEMNGIIAGMEESGVDMNLAGLNRDFNLGDLKLVNALIDLSALVRIAGEFGCSSFSSWGEATQQAPELNGEVVVSRLLDWSTNSSLIENALLIIHEPSEINEQKWMSFTYPGLIGGLTALNESGTFAELNMGNVAGSSSSLFSPVLLDVRAGIEQLDFNSDGASNYGDVYSAIQAETQSNGFIIMVVNATVESNPAICIETNADSTCFRDVSDNTLLQGTNLAATNHFRKLSEPVYCSRYNNLINNTTNNSSYTVESNYSTLSQSAGLSNNMMAIQYIPSLNMIKWSNYYLHQPAFQHELIEYNITNLFNGVLTSTASDMLPINQDFITNYPNPFNPETTISFALETQSLVSLEIYNIKGQKVKTLLNENLSSGQHNVVWKGDNNLGEVVSSGIYFSRLIYNAETKTHKMILAK